MSLINEIEHDGLKDVFEEIKGHYIWLKALRETYKVLYETKENTKIIDKSAKMFFDDINIMMIHQIVLCSCKLTDEYNRKNKNLVLGYFLELDQFNTDSRIIELYTEIQKFRRNLIKARNKIVAHNDFDAIMRLEKLGGFSKGEDIAFLNNIEKYLNIVSEKTTGQIMGEIVVNLPGDVNDLLRYLQYGLSMERMLDDEETLEGKMKIDKYMNMEII